MMLDGFSMCFRSEITDTWNAVLNKTAYIPFSYTDTSIEFQSAYQRSHGGNWHDISVIIYWDSKPVAVWPLTLSVKNDRVLISSQGMPVQAPLYVDFCTSSSRKRISKSCLDIIDNLAKELNIFTWDSSESFNQSLGFSEWHTLAMSRGSTCSIYHDLFLNLQSSMDQIKSNFRKSYKSLITSGMKNWAIDVLNISNESIWDQFKALHLEVSGKKTRSDETWDIHFNDIKKQQGFLVYLLNNSGKMEGGGFFNFSRDEGLYAVGAYNRALFDKPLGHIVQYRAIQELKKRGVVWYKLGSRPYFSEKPEATEKEISIAEFKQGFASHILPRFILSHRFSGS